MTAPRWLVPGALVLLLATGGVWYASGRDEGEVRVDRYGDRIQRVPAGALPVFARDAGPKVAGPYRFAASEAGRTLEWIPCYCGCANIGHRSNRDCYVAGRDGAGVTFTSHGAT
jgi:hypothetical protein